VIVAVNVTEAPAAGVVVEGVTTAVVTSFETVSVETADDAAAKLVSPG
jgi:hypothetical protein